MYTCGGKQNFLLCITYICSLGSLYAKQCEHYISVREMAGDWTEPSMAILHLKPYSAKRHVKVRLTFFCCLSGHFLKGSHTDILYIFSPFLVSSPLEPLLFDYSSDIRSLQ